MSRRSCSGPRMLVIICICVFATALWTAARVGAQSGYPRIEDPRLGYVLPQPTLEELQREYDSIKIWAPAVGIPVSYFTIGGGFGLIMAGSLNLDFCFTATPCEATELPRTPGERALIGAGSVVVAVGAAGFIASVIRLSQKNRKRRALRRQMALIEWD